MLPKSIQNLINHFTKLPSVGPRQAARFVFYLIKQPKKDLEEFAKTLFGITKNLKKCSSCFKAIDVEGLPANPPAGVAGRHGSVSYVCDICKNPKRDKSFICIVEKDTDIESIEKTGRYNGLYHVLGGNEIKDFSEKNLRELHLKELIERIQPPAGHPQGEKKIKEIIIAISATTDGDTLALYISRLLKPLSLPVNKQGIKITRLGRGLSTGSELEYMDEETLSQALLGRK